MAIADTLGRVEADLAQGRVTLARQRLRGLVGQYPDRLDLRDRLAELYRLDGDQAQAGRWSYLQESPNAIEVAAFQRAYGKDPVKVMRMLRWAAGEESAPSPIVQARLRARAGLWSRIGTVLGAGGCLLVVALVIIGIIAAINTGISTVVDWLS